MLTSGLSGGLLFQVSSAFVLRDLASSVSKLGRPILQTLTCP